MDPPLRVPPVSGDPVSDERNAPSPPAPPPTRGEGRRLEAGRALGVLGLRCAPTQAIAVAPCWGLENSGRGHEDTKPSHSFVSWCLCGEVNQAGPGSGPDTFDESSGPNDMGPSNGPTGRDSLTDRTGWDSPVAANGTGFVPLRRTRRRRLERSRRFCNVRTAADRLPPVASSEVLRKVVARCQKTTEDVAFFRRRSARVISLWRAGTLT